MPIRVNREEEININRFGEIMKIINYIGRDDFDILFENGYIKHCTCYNNFKRGSIKNPNTISFFGIASLNVDLESGLSDCISYKTWRHMLSRCYDKKEKRYKFYGGVGVTVCEEWLSYKSFKEWFDINYYEILDDKMNLDKDILNKWNKDVINNPAFVVKTKVVNNNQQSILTFNGLVINEH